MYLKTFLNGHNIEATCVKQRAQLSRPNAQRGSMLVMSLFVIIVVGLLSAALIKIISTASNTTIAQVYGLRAQQAAQTGVQGLLQNSFPVGANPVACNQTISSNNNFSSVPGLQNCIYQASCQTRTITFASVDYYYYKFSSTGTCTIDTDVVSRTISVDAIQLSSP